MDEVEPAETTPHDVRQLVEYARLAAQNGLRFGTVDVAYLREAPESGQVWVQATCSACGAEATELAGGYQDLHAAAVALSFNGCRANGHRPVPA